MDDPFVGNSWTCDITIPFHLKHGKSNTPSLNKKRTAVKNKKRTFLLYRRKNSVYGVDK
jgi:hypothetical protein